MPYIYTTTWKVSAAGNPFAVKTKVWVPNTPDPKSEAQAALAARRALDAKNRASAAALAKAQAKHRMWKELQISTKEAIKKVAPKPVGPATGGYMSPAERIARQKANDALAKRAADKAAKNVGIDPGLTAAQQDALEKQWQISPDRAKKVLEGRKAYYTGRLAVKNASAAGNVGKKKSGEALEAVLSGAKDKQVATNGQYLDNDLINAASDAYKVHVEKVITDLNAKSAKMNSYLIIGKHGKNKGKVIGYVGGDRGRQKALDIQNSASYKALVAEHKRLFGDKPTVDAKGNIITNGKYTVAMANLKSIETNQRIYIREAAKAAFFADRTLTGRDEWARDKAWESEKWFYEASMADIDPTQTSLIYSTDKHGKVTSRHRTVPEEFAFRKGQFTAKMEYEMAQAQNRALQQRILDMPTGRDEWQMTRPSTIKRNLDVEAIKKWTMTLAGGTTVPEDYLGHRENVDKIVQHAMQDWETTNKRLFQSASGRAGGRGTGDGMTHSDLVRWNTARAEQEKAYYEILGTNPKGLIDFVADAPVLREGASALFTAGSSIMGGARAGLMGATTALKTHFNIGPGTTSQVDFGVTGGDLPDDVKNRATQAGKKAEAEARARWKPGDPVNTVLSAAAWAERDYIHNWRNSPEGRRWETGFLAQRKASSDEEAVKFIKTFYGGTEFLHDYPEIKGGSVMERMQAFQDFSGNLTSQPLVNMALGMGLDPTMAFPLKATTWLDRFRHAAQATQGMSKGMRLAKGFYEFQKITEADLQFKKGAKLIAEAVGQGMTEDQVVEKILQSVAGITDPTARDIAGHNMLKKMGLEIGHTNEHMLLSAAQEVLLDQLKLEKGTYKSVADRVLEFETGEIAKRKALREAELVKARAHDTKVSAQKAADKAEFEGAAMRMADVRESEIAAAKAELEAAKQPLERVVEPPLERTARGSLVEEARTVVSEMMGEPVSKRAETPTAVQIHVAAGLPATPRVVELREADTVRSMLSEGSQFHTAPKGGLNDVRVVQPDAAQGLADIVHVMFDFSDVTIHHGVEFANNDFARNFLASPEYREIERILGWEVPAEDKIAGRLSYDAPGAVAAKDVQRHRAQVLADQAEARRTLQNMGKESIWQRNRELESVGREAGPLVKGAIPWDETRGRWSIVGGRKHKDMYIATPSDAAQASASRSGVGAMGTIAERRGLELIETRMVQAAYGYELGKSKPKAIGALTRKQYYAEIREIRRLGVIRRSGDITADLAAQEGALISVSELKHMRVDQVRDFIPIGNQVVNDFLKTKEIGPYYHNFSLIPGLMKGPGYETGLMANIFKPLWRARLTKEGFLEMFGRHFTVIPSALPGPIEFRQMGAHLYALFHLTLADSEQALANLDVARRELMIRATREKMTKEEYAAAYTLLIRDAHAASNGSLDLLHQYSLGVLETLAKDPTNIYARMWQVMEARAGVWWADPHMDVEERFLATALGTGYPLHPNLSLAMIRSGPVVRVDSIGQGFTGHLRNMAFTDSALFASSPYKWVDKTVVAVLDRIASGRLAADESVRLTTMISHYIASRYGNTRRRGWFKVVLRDHSISLSADFSREGGKGAKDYATMRAAYIEAEAEKRLGTVDISTMERSAVRLAAGGEELRFVTDAQREQFGREFDNMWKQGIEPVGVGMMPQTRHEIEEGRAPVKPRARGKNPKERLGFDDTLRQVYEDLYWKGEVTHDNPGLHTMTFLERMGDPKYQRGEWWLTFAKPYYVHMVGAGARKEADEVLRVLFEQKITRSIRDLYEEVQGNRAVSIYDDLIAHVTKDIEIENLHISVGGAGEEVLVAGKLHPVTEFFLSTGHISTENLKRSIAEGEQRVAKERGLANTEAELAAQRDELLIEDETMREKRRAAESESDGAAMYSMATVDHLADDVQYWADDIAKADADLAKLEGGLSNLQLAEREVDRARVLVEKTEKRIYAAARNIGANPDDSLIVQRIEAKMFQLRKKRKAYQQVGDRLVETEEYRVLRTEAEAEREAVLQRASEQRAAYLAGDHPARKQVLAVLHAAENRSLDYAHRLRAELEWAEEVERLEAARTDLFNQGKTHTKGYRRRGEELAAAKRELEALRAAPDHPSAVGKAGYAPPSDIRLRSLRSWYFQILDDPKLGEDAANRFLQGAAIQLKGKTRVGARDSVTRAYVSAAIRKRNGERQLVRRMTSIVHRTLDMESVPVSVGDELKGIAEVVSGIEGGKEVLATWAQTYADDLYQSRLIDYVKNEDWFKYVDTAERAGKGSPLIDAGKAVSKARGEVQRLTDALRTGLIGKGGFEERITDYPYYEAKLAEANAQLVVARERVAAMKGARAEGSHVPKPSTMPTEEAIGARTGPIVGAENLPPVEPWISNRIAVGEGKAPVYSTERRAPTLQQPGIAGEKATAAEERAAIERNRLSEVANRSIIDYMESGGTDPTAMVDAIRKVEEPFDLLDIMSSISRISGMHPDLDMRPAFNALDRSLNEKGLRRFTLNVGDVATAPEHMRLVQAIPGGKGSYIGSIERDGLVAKNGDIVAPVQVVLSPDPAAIAPTPTSAAAVDEPTALTRDRAQREALGFDTNRFGEGWKLHLGFDASDPEVVAEIEAVLVDLHGRGLIANFKIGHAGDQIGKDATVYIGARDMSDFVAAELDRVIGKHLKAPEGEVLEDDISFVGNIMGRFENSGSPRGRAASAAGVPVDEKGMHQYGAKGHAILNWDMRMGHMHPETFDLAEATRRADAILRKQYGDFYTGTGVTDGAPLQGHFPKASGLTREAERGLTAEQAAEAADNAEMVPTEQLQRYMEEGREDLVRGSSPAVDKYLDDLVADIKANGLRRPIELHEYSPGGLINIVDGNHRLVAATEAGLPDIPTVVRKADGSYEPPSSLLAPEAKPAGAAPPELPKDPPGPPPPRAPDPDEFDHDRIRAAQEGLEALTGMTEREWLNAKLVEAKMKRSRARSSSGRNQWNNRVNDINKSLRVIDVAESGGKKRFRSHATRKMERRTVLHTVGDRAKQMIAPNRMSPFVFHAGGLEIEQARTYNVMRLNSVVNGSIESKIRKPGQVSDSYLAHGATIEEEFGRQIDSDLLMRAGLKKESLTGLTPTMLAVSMDDFRSSALRNPKFGQFVTRYLENMEERLQQITGNPNYRLEDWLDDRLIGHNADYLDVRVHERVDKRMQDAMQFEREGATNQSRTDLVHRKAEKTDETEVLAEMVERDVRAVIAKAKVASDEHLDLHAYNEGHKVLRRGHVTKLTGYQLVRESSRAATAAMEKAGRFVEDADWDALYREEYTKEFLARRIKLSDDEALALLDKLAQEMPGASHYDIITEFEARYSLNMEVKGEELNEITRFQMRTLEEATKHLLGVDDLNDPVKMKVGLSRHETAPPMESRAAQRDWLTRYGFWSPRGREAIETGKKSWSMKEEAKYFRERWGDTPDWANPEMWGPGGEYNELLYNERKRGEMFRQWGHFNRNMEARFHSGEMSPEEQAIFLSEGDEVLGLKARRDLELERKYAEQRYGDLIMGEDGQWFAMPELMLENERRVFIQNTLAENIPEGMFRDMESHDIFMNYLRLHANEMIDSAYAGREVTFPELFTMASKIIHDMMMDPIWLRRENGAFGDFMNMQAEFRRLAVMTNPAFTMTNVVDLALKVPYTRFSHRSFFRPGEISELAKGKTPAMYGLTPGGQFLRDRPISGWQRISAAGKDRKFYPLPDGTVVEETVAQKRLRVNLERVHGTMELPAQIAGLAQDAAMYRMAQGMFDEAYRRGIEELGFSPRVAEAYAQKFAGEQAMRTFPSQGDGPMERLLNMVFPFMSYQAKNHLFWIGEFADHPFMFNWLNQIGLAIEKSNRAQWEADGTTNQHTSLELRRFTLPWAPDITIDFGKISDAGSGIAPAMDLIAGKATVGSLVSQFVRLASANDQNMVLGWMNALHFGMRKEWMQEKDANGYYTGVWHEVEVPWEAPFGGDANWLNSFWPVQIGADINEAMLDGKFTPSEITRIAYRAAFFGGVTQHDKGKGLSEFYFALKSKDPAAAERFLLTPDGVALKVWWMEKKPSTRDWNPSEIQNILFPRHADSNPWLHGKDAAFQFKVKQGFEALRVIRTKWMNILWKLTPGTPEFANAKLQMSIERFAYYENHPEMFEYDGFSKTADDWAKELDDWTTDDLTDTFFNMKPPEKRNGETQKSFNKRYDAWLESRRKYLIANPKVAERLASSRTEVEAIWKQTEQHWFDDILDKIGTRGIAIEAAKQSKNFPLADQLYLANDLDYMKLGEETAVHYFDPTTDFVPLGFDKNGKEKQGPRFLRQDPFGHPLLKRVQVLPDFDKWRYDRADPAKKAVIRRDMRYSAGIQAVIDKAKKSNNFAKTFVELIKADPWLRDEYFRRNEGKREKWASTDAYIHLISRFGKLMRAGKFDEGHKYFENLPPWVKDRYYSTHPAARKRRADAAETLKYMHYMKLWTDHYRKRDYAGGATYFSKLPTWVKNRYYSNHPQGTFSGGSSPYSKAMGKWVGLLQAGDKEGAKKWFDSMPQAYRDRYYKGHPEAKLRDDIKHVGMLGEYFSADDANRAQYLADNPEFAKWLKEQGTSEQTRRMMIAAAYRALPDDSWLKRMFREKYPEVFSKEAVGEARTKAVLSFLAEHPEMTGPTEKWIAAILASYAEELKHAKSQPKPWVAAEHDRQHGMVNRARPHGGKSAAWVRLHSLS